MKTITAILTAAVLLMITSSHTHAETVYQKASPNTVYQQQKGGITYHSNSTTVYALPATTTQVVHRQPQVTHYAAPVQQVVYGPQPVVVHNPQPVIVQTPPPVVVHTPPTVVYTPPPVTTTTCTTSYGYRPYVRHTRIYGHHGYRPHYHAHRPHRHSVRTRIGFGISFNIK